MGKSCFRMRDCNVQHPNLRLTGLYPPDIGGCVPLHFDEERWMDTDAANHDTPESDGLVCVCVYVDEVRCVGFVVGRLCGGRGVASQLERKCVL